MGEPCFTTIEGEIEARFEIVFEIFFSPFPSEGCGDLFCFVYAFFFVHHSS